MKSQDIKCCKCGKFLFTEHRQENNEIKCIKGSYDNCFYHGEEDQFYCLECAKKLGLE